MNATKFCTGWAGAAVALAMAFAAPSAEATEVLRPSLAKIAAAVMKIVQTRGADSVAVGQFSGPANFGSNAGPGIQKILAEELQRQGVKVKKFGAALGVQGQYLYTSAEGAVNEDAKQIRLKVVLTDGSGQPLTSLNQEVSVDPNAVQPGPTDDNRPLPPRLDVPEKIVVRGGEIDLDTFTEGAEAAALLGVTWDFERSGLGFVVDRDIVTESFRRPTAEIVAGTAVRSSPSSKYFVEVFVGNQPRPLRLEDGQPVVDLNKGETFSLRVTNRKPHDVAVFLTLDGVNSFAFSKVRRPDGGRLTRYIIEENRPMWIKGWFDTTETTTEFKVTDFSESAAALVGSESGLGMITVLLRSSWLGNEEPPQDEPGIFRGQIAGSANVGSQFGSQDSGIGFGNKIRQQGQIVTGRTLGVVRSIITIRYDKPKDLPPGDGPAFESPR